MARSGISDVTVQVEELKDHLRVNREHHRGVYDRAVERFREKALERVEALATTLRAGKMPDSLYLGLPIPEEHTRDYDRAIRMLIMHVEPTITLTEQAYAQLVEDDWGWRESFASNTSSYLAAADGQLV